MSRVCGLCGKKKQIGRQSRHRRGVAGKQWAKRAQKTVRVFRANLHPKTINGVRMMLCTKCIKRMKADKKQIKADKGKQIEAGKKQMEADDKQIAR